MKSLAAFALATASPAAAASDVLIPAFRDYRIATHGDPAQGMAAARAAGRMPVCVVYAGGETVSGMDEAKELARHGEINVIMTSVERDKSMMGLMRP
jgi:hypothetical protein